MICKECKSEVGVSKKIVKEYSIPYKCTKCGNIHFKYQALHGVVFVWPKPIKEMTDGGVLIPEFAQYNLKSSYGVVLSSGKGCKNRKTGKFVDSDLNIGDIILYDKSIPWKMNVEATDGKEYEVNLMNVLDINAIVGIEE